MKPLVMVTKNGCSMCEQLKRKAMRSGTEVIEFDIDKLPEENIDTFQECFPRTSLPIVAVADFEFTVLKKLWKGEFKSSKEAE